MKPIGEKLKRIRVDNGLTIEALIERLNKNYNLNISKSMVSRWENGHSEPINTFVAAYAKEFGIDMNYLVGIKGIEFAKLPKRTIKIPVVGSVPAGVPIEALENILYEVELDYDVAKSGEHFGLVIEGDSSVPFLCKRGSQPNVVCVFQTPSIYRDEKRRGAGSHLG